MQRSELDDLLHRGHAEKWSIDEDYQIELVANTQAYPFLDLDGRTVHPAVVSVFQMEKTEAGKPKIHTVVLACCQDEDYFVWCGDTYLEGRIRKKGVAPDDRRRAVLAWFHASRRDEAEGCMLSLFGIAANNTGCNFWARWNSDKRPCKHVYTVLTKLASSGELNNKLDQLAEHYKAFTQGMPSAAQRSDLTEAALIERLAFRRPILLEGDRGSGKTVTARAFAKQHGLPLVSVDGQEGLEAIDLLGHFVVDGKGGWVWKDGYLSEAFRLAARTKTVLLVDEMLRIDTKQLSPFLSGLSPFEGKYSLNTGRIVDVVEGIGRVERLQCPVENLCVIATTNIGGEYAVSALDPALAERFLPIRKDTKPEDIERVGAQVLAAKGFDPAIAAKLRSFFCKMAQMVQQGMAQHAPTLRTLTGALDMAANEGEIGLWLRQSTLLWVGRDVSGYPVQDQVDAVYQLINKEFA